MSIYRVYEYSNSLVPYKHILLKGDRKRAGETTKQTEYERREKFIENDSKMEKSLSRARRNIVDICLCNDWDYFCTFEFNASNVDRYDLKVCYEKLRKFFNNFKTRYAPNFKYLCIPEFHPKSGAIHFHGVVSGLPQNELTIPSTIQWRNPETDELEQKLNTKGYVRWDRYSKSLGYFDCSRIRSRERIAFYITKYITKEIAQIPKGVKLYCCSLGLNRPELVYDGDDDYMRIAPSYENDYVKVSYEKYGEFEAIKNEHDEVHKAFGDSSLSNAFMSVAEASAFKKDMFSSTQFYRSFSSLAGDESEYKQLTLRGVIDEC